MKIFYALFVARNREYLRDRGTLAWNLLFPFLAIFVMALVFSGSGRALYKVGLLGESATDSSQPLEFLATRFVDFVPVKSLPEALERVRRHQFDLVLDLSGKPRYWVNESNPKGYFLERVLWGSGGRDRMTKQVLEGREIRYVDWLLPGVLSMNMMFSCLFGVGYVVVRYRSGGILRRFKVTPVTAVQFLSAQIVSRMILVMVITTVLFFGADLVLDFYVLGSLPSLFLVFALGAFCLITMGLVVASRTQSQELAGGMLNLVIWPMMFLSEVWFSLEGSHPLLIRFAQLFPLTHMITASRRIMVDGAGLFEVWPQIALLSAMSLVFLFLGAFLFRWD